MKLIDKIIFSAIAVSGLALACPAYAAYVVTLTNGETINADNYKVKDDKIELKLKDGSASFPRSLVASISKDGSSDNLVSPPPAKSVSSPPAASIPPASASASNQPQVPSAAKPSGHDGQAAELGQEEDAESSEDEKILEELDKVDADQADKMNQAPPEEQETRNQQGDAITGEQ